MYLYHDKVKPPGSLVIFAVFIFISVAGVTDAVAGSEEKLLGTWLGDIWVDDKPIRVDLKIESVKGKQGNNKFHYSEPRACRLTPEFVAKRNARYWFVLRNPTGNICNKLSAGHLILELRKGDKELAYEVSSIDDTYKETGELKKQ